MTPDTNVLVRTVVLDDPEQTRRATVELSSAPSVVLTLPALCEFCWVLRSRYGYSPGQIRQALEAMVGAPNVKVDREAVGAGIAMLNLGGDFADAVIAHSGRRQGGQEFVSFDRQAVSLLRTLGDRAREPH